MIASLLFLLCCFSFHLGYSCSTDEDCSLNGGCTGGSCNCRPPWTGQDCGTMKFLPTPGPGYGKNPTLTAWGGNVIRDNGGTYHLFVAEMANECLLNTWGQNSFCRHATAKDILGPYTAQEIAVNVWCHNPHVVTLPDGTFAMFHIGAGNGGNPRNCTHEGNEESSDVINQDFAPGSSIHVAKSLNGPWTPLDPNPLPGCNNPAPWVSKNGTIFVICDSTQFYWTSSISGPWNHITTIKISGGPCCNYEDPFLWTDINGHFHVIYHVYNTKEGPTSCVSSTVSAHAFSPDGYTWKFNPKQPYTTQVQTTSGSITVATRERPKMFFDSTGRESYLFNGVCSVPDCTDSSTGCVDCKANHWDYWLPVPLAVS